MEHKKIVIPSLSFFQDELKGEGVVKSRRTLGELAGIFENQDAYSCLLYTSDAADDANWV